MKRTKIIVSAALTAFSVVGSAHGLSVSKREKKLEDKIESVFNRVDSLLEGFEMKTSLKQQKMSAYNSYGDEEEFDFDVLKSVSSEILYEHKDSFDYFRHEMFENISKDDLYQMTSDISLSDLYDLADTPDLKSFVSEIDIQKGIDYARSILIEENIDEELSSYLDDIEFRDFCLNQELNFDNPDERTDEQIAYIEHSRENFSLVADQIGLNYSTGPSFMVDPCGGSDGSGSGSLEGNYLEPENQQLLPSDVCTVEQLRMIFSDGATASIVTSLGFVGSGAAAACLGFIGKIAAAVLIGLGVVCLLFFAQEIIKNLPFVIGFFINSLAKFISFVTSFFISVQTYSSAHALDQALSGHQAEITALNMTETEVRNIAKASVRCGTRTANISKLPDQLIVCLGVTGVYDTYAKENGYYYYMVDDYKDLLERIGYEGVWLINMIFLDIMIYKNAIFELCSRPSLYYIPGQIDVLQERGYAFELRYIYRHGYRWIELPQEPYMHCFARKLQLGL